jgi:hypothetical protein
MTNVSFVPDRSSPFERTDVDVASLPYRDLQLLALGGQRLDQLEDRAQTAFAGSTAEADLGPRWVARRLAEHPADPV